jgi:hypothetical protein
MFGPLGQENIFYLCRKWNPWIAQPLVQSLYRLSPPGDIILKY